MARSILITSMVTLPVATGYVALANLVALPRGLVVGLFVLVVGLSSGLLVYLEDRRRSPPPRRARRE
jgi:hypothetical protein